ncbi:hypothetical protein RNAN_3483 [Rheinheimera nanhaiensis E407-8]|uniref:Uncharacterized protein n=2 Tax=Rheinheimera TaxID=67575 RepID=I1E2D1_9GAMM|nr:hypothetical protein RNAN_3483 [Rheinheimera nanhaiensis E407-8]
MTFGKLGKRSALATFSSSLLLIMSAALMPYAAYAQKSYQALTNVISLLDSPEQYFDKAILVDGYFVGFHHDALYFSKDHAELRISSYAINVLDDSDTEEGSLSFSPCNGEWVQLSGTFIKAQQPGISYAQGRLVIDSAMLHKNGDICWQRTTPSFLERQK